MNCEICGKESELTIYGIHACKTCSFAIKRFKCKYKAIMYKGGKCSNCGYNKCFNALEFHHINPNEKDFSFARITSIKWETVKQELDKCVLLCANCHRKAHHINDFTNEEFENLVKVKNN